MFLGTPPSAIIGLGGRNGESVVSETNPASASTGFADTVRAA